MVVCLILLVAISGSMLILYRQVLSVLSCKLWSWAAACNLWDPPPPSPPKSLFPSNPPLQVIRYFSQPKRDPTWGRIGVVWSIFIALLNAITGNIQNGLMIMNQDNFISSALRDRVSTVEYLLLHHPAPHIYTCCDNSEVDAMQYFFQLEMLWVNLIHVPVLVLFTRRAWVLWDRRKIVLVVCLAPITAMAILTLVASVTPLSSAARVRFRSDTKVEPCTAWTHHGVSRLSPRSSLRGTSLRMRSTSPLGSLWGYVHSLCGLPTHVSVHRGIRNEG
jgi:hypothetical protein